MKVTVYGLLDPESCKIRYIGRTRNDLEIRLAQHLSTSKTSKSKSYKQNWICSLLKRNKKPIIKPLQFVEGWEKSHVVERNLIEKHFVKRKLTNGYDIGCIETMSEETLFKISKGLKNFYQNNLNAKAKPIEVYDLKGDFIKVCDSATQFANEIGVKPRLVTRVAAQEKGRKSVKGFQVKYQSDIEVFIKEVEYKPSITKGRVFEKKRKEYTIQHKDTKETWSFKGALEICTFFKCSRSHFNVSKRKNSLLLGTYHIIPGSV